MKLLVRLCLGWSGCWFLPLSFLDWQEQLGSICAVGFSAVVSLCVFSFYYNKYKKALAILADNDIKFWYKVEQAVEALEVASKNLSNILVVIFLWWIIVFVCLVGQ